MAAFPAPIPATPVPATIPGAVQARTVTPMGSLFARIMNSRTRCAPPTAATGAMRSSIYRVSFAVRKVGTPAESRSLPKKRQPASRPDFSGQFACEFGMIATASPSAKSITSMPAGSHKSPARPNQVPAASMNFPRHALAVRR